jgi:predicted MFS family arabinose efflux permease
MTVVLGVAEMAGLSTLLVAHHLDRGRERAAVAVALASVAAGSTIILVGSFAGFALGYFLVVLGATLCTIGGHTFLSRRVRFERRARAIGTFELSWALGLLIGAPGAAILIRTVGWRAPFAVTAGLALVALAAVRMHPDRSRVLADATDTEAPRRLTSDAWLAVAASSAIAVTGLTTIAIAGTWLDDALGVSTGGVGAVAIAFGLAELTASSSSAIAADRIGPTRATRVAIAVAVIGLVVMIQADTSLVVGAAGLFCFFVGFEFAIVTSFSIVSETLPAARGRVLATNTAVATVLRGTGVAVSGTLYERFGVGGPATVSITTAAVAFVALTVLRRRAAHLITAATTT